MLVSIRTLHWKTASHRKPRAEGKKEEWKRREKHAEFKTRLQYDDVTESKMRRRRGERPSIQFILVSATNLICVLCQLNYENAQFNAEESTTKTYTLFQSFNCAVGRRRQRRRWLNQWKNISVAINYMYIETTAMKKKHNDPERWCIYSELQIATKCKYSSIISIIPIQQQQ